MDTPYSERERFEVLEDCLENIVDHTRDSGIIVCDYQSSITFQKKINELVQKLQELERFIPAMKDLHVPTDVFAKIDAAHNPNLYTKECLERCLMRNEAVRGKLDILKRFRAQLMCELSKEFPNEIAKYRSKRGDPEIPLQNFNGTSADRGDQNR